ncbi:MAG TPA: DUF4012 domain-containing protein [Anaerolineae bacterium]|nr:DUF4012 domain-containing protein [Anaerolineae bacterium]HIQ05693.1 DUF4012 domain-containing protein [Anaerolineae bacterium]
MSTSRRIVLILLVILLIIGGLLAYTVYRIVVPARAALEELRALQRMATPQAMARFRPQQLVEVRDRLARLEADFAALEEAAGPFLPLTTELGWLPQVGGVVQNAPALLTMAREMSHAGRATLDGVSPLVDLLEEKGGRADLMAATLPALVNAKPDFAEAQAAVEQVAVACQELDVTVLPMELAAPLREFDRFLPLLRTALQAAQVAPDLLGVDGERTYLILAQNSDELRATGGFISGVGLLRLEKGQIVDISFRDSYAVDDLSKPHPPAPLPLRRYMDAEILLLRDVNWSPDFPTTAQMARTLYQLDQGVAADGVIALDTQAVQLLVDALGPLTVPGFDHPVTGANVIAFMKQVWERPPEAKGSIKEGGGGDWWRHRKDFMQLLMRAVMARLQGQGPPPDPARLARALFTVLEERHLLISLADPEAATPLREAGWDGALRPGDGDFLMVVDTNMGFNKVNAAVSESLAYTVTVFPDGGAEAMLTIRYRHNADVHLDECVHEARYGETYDDMIRRCYWDYVRVYAPGNSELLETKGWDAGSVTAEPGERGTTLFAGFFVLKPGETHTVRLRYELPAAVVADNRYQLQVQKQPGTNANPLHIVFRGLPEWALTDPQPSNVSVSGSAAILDTDLRTDRGFAVRW